jgi:hypothetical protein
VSALPQALPLALSAAIYPPALLVLMLLMTGHEPRPLVLAYFAGAATLTLGAGLVALAVLDAANLTPRDSKTASGAADIVVGVLLLAVAAWAWRRSARGPRDAPAGQGRIAQWSQRATSSRRWALVLGLAMYLPSPLYLLAVKEIADGGGSSASKVAAVAICALGVLLFIEVPLVALYLRPAGVAAALERFNAWLGRNGWRLAAALALIAGVYAIVKGVAAL